MGCEVSRSSEQRIPLFFFIPPYLLVSSPRPPLPLSATLTEEEAATIIQAHYRSYLVRKNPEGQLFRYIQQIGKKAFDPCIILGHGNETCGMKGEQPAESRHSCAEHP